MQANLRSVQARRAAIAHEMNALHAEDAELETVEAVLARLANGKVATSAAPKSAIAKGASSAVRGKPGRKRNGDLSQRELVLDALESAPDPWQKVQDIIAAAKARHGVAMPARSISPLLSNLKKTKQIVRKGRLVALPKRAKR